MEVGDDRVRIAPTFTAAVEPFGDMGTFQMGSNERCILPKLMNG